MYSIIDVMDTRVLMVPPKEAHRWRFYTRINGKRHAIQLKLSKKTGFLQARVDGKILQYKMPHANDLHWERLKLSSRRFFIDANRKTKTPYVLPSEEQLVENMLVFEAEL